MHRVIQSVMFQGRAVYTWLFLPGESLTMGIISLGEKEGPAGTEQRVRLSCGASIPNGC